MKHYFVLLLIILIVPLISSCSYRNDYNERIKENVGTVKVEDDIQGNDEFDEQTINENDNDNESVVIGDTSKIEVTFSNNYIDGDKLYLKVYAKNTSENIFSGNICLMFYTLGKSKLLGSDIMLVDELMPGQRSWTNVIVDKYNGSPEMEFSFSNVSFKPVKETVAEVDADTTKNIKDNYRFSFESVSWYNDITDIVVYTDKTCVVTLKDNPKNEGQFYAGVIWNCGNDVGVKLVKVVDSSEKILTVYSR